MQGLPCEVKLAHCANFTIGKASFALHLSSLFNNHPTFSEKSQAFFGAIGESRGANRNLKPVS